MSIFPYNNIGDKMKLRVENTDYDIIIEKKRGNKNTYIRIKNDLKIYVTTNLLTTNKYIEKLLEENYKSIVKMLEKEKKKLANNTGFRYLGKEYNIIYTEYCDISFGNGKVFLNKNIDIDKWYKNQAKTLFKSHLDEIYNKFTKKIPYPELKIRKMSTRWGVCNTKSKTVTLNLELIKRETKYLDYVIVHELSHLIHPNHSNRFWLLVEENCPNYKDIRNDMKEF